MTYVKVASGKHMASIALHERPTTDETRARILQVACELFAARGFKATTLREITLAAQVNLAAVNYHFRSKEELVSKALEVSIAPIIAARMTSLDECLAGETASSVERLAIALVRPLFDLSHGEHRNSVMLLMQLSPDPELSRNAIVSKYFAPLHRKFVAVLAAALPHLNKAEVALRYDYARGAVLQTLVELAPACELVSLPARDYSLMRKKEPAIAALVAFVVAGFNAPAALGNRR
jgi:AcrR family transcriptional regulator